MELTQAHINRYTISDWRNSSANSRMNIRVLTGVFRDIRKARWLERRRWPRSWICSISSIRDYVKQPGINSSRLAMRTKMTLKYRLVDIQSPSNTYLHHPDSISNNRSHINHKYLEFWHPLSILGPSNMSQKSLVIKMFRKINTGRQNDNVLSVQDL